MSHGSFASMKIDEISVSAYTLPTDAPESDGTLAWDETTHGIGRGAGRRPDRAGLHLRGYFHCGADSRICWAKS